MYRDYGPKRVKFFFVYKSLAHPELVGNYVQPFTLAERLAHAQQAEKQLGSTIPWLVDPINNPLKHALGDRNNSEFIIDPKGVVVVKRSWSHPAAIRADLERFVGPSERITKEEDIQLKLQLPPPSPAARGTTPRIKRDEKMQAIVSEPQLDPKGPPFYAKLRAEVDERVLTGRPGKLYLGFHLDPILNAHWNNLTRPLTVKLLPAEDVKLSPVNLTAPKVEAASDADPREFLIDVSKWPEKKPVHLIVTYYACVGETNCFAVRQLYELQLQRDLDSGQARGAGAGYWEPEQFTREAMLRDANGDGKLNQQEVVGMLQPHFRHFDKNSDELLDTEELNAVSDWLNRPHQSGPPSR